MRSVQALPADAVRSDLDSPVGKLTIVSSQKGLHAILWEADLENSKLAEILRQVPKSETDPTIVETKRQLGEYFAGERREFRLPLVIEGTAFQKQVWAELQRIPYAKTVSYGEQATRMGEKKKARAVGAANGLNPLSIVIPCHRVIGKNGRLVGFAGGLDKKAFLLSLEQKSCPES